MAPWLAFNWIECTGHSVSTASTQDGCSLHCSPLHYRKHPVVSTVPHACILNYNRHFNKAVSLAKVHQSGRCSSRVSLSAANDYSRPSLTSSMPSDLLGPNQKCWHPAGPTLPPHSGSLYTIRHLGLLLVALAQSQHTVLPHWQKLPVAAAIC